MSYAYDNIGIMNDPRMIALCTNCAKAECTGVCKAISDLAQQIAGAPELRPSKHKGKAPALHTANGQAHSLREWEKITGLGKDLLRGRMKRGMSLSEAIEAGPTPKPKVYTAHGRTQRLYEWVRESGIPEYTLKYRMRVMGMTFEQALDRGQAKR